ncbi:hypothetical protein RvY_06766 [Ramazzottius varieornatus]|uniref:Uncharacterized protein n=1 Tax=Ramazzottius varieornatus TaxID=947166 RepID=A0A1D1UZR3_RAMVA|nr:hypothetical protein RvY_06766 [Ramazzottius varieornatus]
MAARSPHLTSPTSVILRESHEMVVGETAVTSGTPARDQASHQLIILRKGHPEHLGVPSHTRTFG